MREVEPLTLIPARLQATKELGGPCVRDHSKLPNQRFLTFSVKYFYFPSIIFAYVFGSRPRVPKTESPSGMATFSHAALFREVSPMGVLTEVDVPFRGALGQSMISQSRSIMAKAHTSG